MGARIARTRRARRMLVIDGMLTVGEMMKTNLKTVTEDSALSVADWEMTLDEIRHLLVVDATGKLIGIVSDRDVMRARRLLQDGEVPVAKVMRRDVTTLDAHDPAALAVDRMINGKYSALPVVDTRGRPIGIVTSTDFLEVAYEALTGLTPRARVHA